MRRFTCALTCLLLTLALSAFGAPYSVRGKTVTCGSARFDVLAPDLIRMQFSTRGFVDATSAVVSDRTPQPAELKAEDDGKWLTVATARVRIHYRLGSGRFTSENLRADWQNTSGYYEWTPGTADEQNLGGPVSSFNAIIDDTQPGRTLPPFPPGFLSRAGCWLLDDSRTPVWNAAAQWIQPRAERDTHDWYLFVYGTDYRAFYQRYTQLAGKIPMIPHYALGAWVTDINFEYSNQNVPEQYLFDIVSRFRKEQIPLDVFVLDFGWHRFGWEGSLDWSPFIPDPKAFLAKMRAAGLHVSPNDHPSSGLSTKDSRAVAARQALGIPPPETRAWVDISNDWRLEEDVHDVGRQDGWQKPDFKDDAWRPAPVPGPWEDLGLPNYDGLAWYRKWVDVPAAFTGKSVYLSCGGVDDEYDLYVNGNLVRHWGAAGDSVYDKRTTTDITPYVLSPGRNLIALRVLDWGNNGGILKPVILASDPPVDNDSVYFNLADKKQAELYMRYHNELIDQGVGFWWIDGDRATMDGLDSQMWTNRVYYDYQQAHTGERSLIFSRYGGPGSHRYPASFTADCYSNWKVLAWEVPYTVKSGNVLVPYVTHDIGGFIGPLKDDFELYARWVQFGALSPILRLHSAHENPDEGNARLPWAYGAKGTELARRFFQLRYRLIPYLYSYCREAYDTGLPLCRGLYLEYPNEPEAYRRFDEYLLGRELLVAPITSRGLGGLATRSIWFPPGEWTDFFTGKTYPGGRTVDFQCPLERMPLFVRRGSILPMQPDVATDTAAPVNPLILDVYPGADASFSVYEDDGTSLDYKQGRCRRTPVALTGKAGNWVVTIGPPQGAYTGMSPRARYELHVHADRPLARVTANGAPQPVKWDATARVTTLTLAAMPHKAIVVRFSQ